MSAVWIARTSTDVCTTVGAMPAACIRRPASLASVTPSSLSGASYQPVKRFSRFHVLCPWRSRTSVPMLEMAINRRCHLDDLGELLRVEARAADQAAVAQRQLHVSLDVARVDAASVEHAHLSRRARADELAHRLSDHPHRLVRVLGVGALARTYRPHRLVRDDQTYGVIGRAVRKPCPHLPGDDLPRSAGVVVLVELADAHDHAEVVGQGR